MTHQQIQQQDVIERYVRRRLSPDERAAFQEHFFACDECFEQVQMTERFVAGMKDAAVTGVLARQASKSFVDSPSWLGWLKPAFLVTATASLILALVIGWLLLRKIPAMRDEMARQQQLVEQGRQEDRRKLEAAEKQLQSERDARARLQNQLEQETQGAQPKRVPPISKTEENRPELARKTGPAPSENETSESEATRSTNPRAAGASLVRVKRIYVESLGDETFSNQVRAQLIRDLQSSQRFTVTDKKEGTDAVLEASAKRRSARAESAQTGTINVRLVNANGSVIWPGKNKQNYRGRVADITRRIVKDLLDEIQRLERIK